MTARHRNHGFTLSETLAALAVAGIGVSLAVPGVQSLASRNQQATAVNQLVSSLHLARSEAIMRNRPVAICASTDAERCAGTDWAAGWISFVDADGDGERSDEEALLTHAEALPHLALHSPQFGPSITFAVNGRAQAGGIGEFVFCPTGARAAPRVVIVRASGLPISGDNGLDGSPVECATP